MPGLTLPFSVPAIESLAIPAVSFLIFFLAYSSQYLFYHIDLYPGPLSIQEASVFNYFVISIWWCYARACTVDPGRRGWVDKVAPVTEGKDADGSVLEFNIGLCKKCNAVKPPRAHHCRKCGCCIPKMDHHCPWTGNCVSHTTFPHFYRFVFYAVLSMSILEYHLYIRAMVIWDSRKLPAYLGPHVWAMAHLFILLVVNTFTLFALGIILIRAGCSLAVNTTMIESWEIERHEALVIRSLKSSGYVYASGGQRMRIQHQEFPYDIGFWKNICQAMGTKNVFKWFMPFSGGPSVETAGNWEVNGFEDTSKTWPPPDPDKMPRSELAERQKFDVRDYGTPEEELAAFRRRQEQDHKRWLRKENVGDEADGSDAEESENETDDEEDAVKEKRCWTNSDGNRLHDYGVDEEAEVLAEDEMPLAELLRRRKARSYVQS